MPDAIMHIFQTDHMLNAYHGQVCLLLRVGRPCLILNARCNQVPFLSIVDRMSIALNAQLTLPKNILRVISKYTKCQVILEKPLSHFLNKQLV